jgi:hypothetical protein
MTRLIVNPASPEEIVHAYEQSFFPAARKVKTGKPGCGTMRTNGYGIIGEGLQKVANRLGDSSGIFLTELDKAEGLIVEGGVGKGKASAQAATRTGRDVFGITADPGLLLEHGYAKREDFPFYRKPGTDNPSIMVHDLQGYSELGLSDVGFFFANRAYDCLQTPLSSMKQVADSLGENGSAYFLTVGVYHLTGFRGVRGTASLRQIAQMANEANPGFHSELLALKKREGTKQDGFKITRTGEGRFSLPLYLGLSPSGAVVEFFSDGWAEGKGFVGADRFSSYIESCGRTAKLPVG